MDDNTKQVIDTLSAKLGTTAEHLWGVLIRQAPIDAATSCIMATLMAGAVVPLIRIAIKSFKKSEEYSTTGVAECACVATTVMCFGLALIFLISTGIFLANFQTVVAGFYNPEFWAFKQIIK